MFPIDAKTIHVENAIATRQVLLPDVADPYTVLSLSASARNSQEMFELDCDLTVVYSVVENALAGGQISTPLSVVCDGEVGITFDRTSNHTATVVFLERDISIVGPNVPGQNTGDFAVAMGLGFIIFILMLKVGNDMVRK